MSKMAAYFFRFKMLNVTNMGRKELLRIFLISSSFCSPHHHSASILSPVIAPNLPRQSSRRESGIPASMLQKSADSRW